MSGLTSGAAKIPQFRCDICYRTFTTKGNLSRHFQAAHVGGVKFPCHICGKEFKRKEDRNTHLRIHTGEARDDIAYKWQQASEIEIICVEN